MKPTKKHPSIEKTLTSTFGFDRRDSIKQDVCAPPPMGCGKPALAFRDPASRSEFRISGFCQTCQDKIWTHPDHVNISTCCQASAIVQASECEGKHDDGCTNYHICTSCGKTCDLQACK